jgi:hypothetical protein
MRIVWEFIGDIAYAIGWFVGNVKWVFANLFMFPRQED